jgi:hypothetical protein|tara:strand:- start:376 stop:1902 length:1527 start_codon:yes stop_codon:yes gene_type:complete
MALKNLKSNFRALLRDVTSKEFKNYATSLGAETLVVFNLDLDDLVRGSKKGTSLVGEQLRGETKESYESFNTDANWKKIVGDELKRIKRTKLFGSKPIGTFRAQSGAGLPKAGVYFGQTIQTTAAGNFKLLIWCNTGAEADLIVDKAVDEIVDNLWDSYTTTVIPSAVQGNFFGTQQQGSTATQRRSGNPATTKQVFRGGLKKQHGADSTTAKSSLESLKNPPATKRGLSTKGKLPVSAHFNMEVISVVDFLMANVTADWNQTNLKRKFGQYNVKNVLELSLGKNDDLPTDANKLVEVLTPFLQKEIKKQGLFGIDAENSKPIKTQIADDVANDIIDNIKITSRGKTLKVTRKKKPNSKFSTKPRKGKLATPSTFKTKKKQGVIKTKGKKIPKRRPGKEQRSQTSNLLQLEAQINKRLPAEVRRNMGRPALRNQTGRFSNSAEVKQLRQTAAGISGVFGYMTSPYETFESTGKRIWPTGYNPKPLITKSIRTLAIQYTSQKLVSLRRE